MKALLLAAATLSAVACASEPTAAVRVDEHTMSAEPERPGVSGAADPTTTTEVTTTTVEATTTITEPATTTIYVAPATTRRVTTTTVYEPPAPQGRSTGRGTEPPAGDMPPDYIKQCESGGNYQAVNPNGHYGAWQFSMSTWASVGGTGRPDQASPAEQDYRASLLWDGGAGASHWACA